MWFCVQILQYFRGQDESFRHPDGMRQRRPKDNPEIRIFQIASDTFLFLQPARQTPVGFILNLAADALFPECGLPAEKQSAFSYAFSHLDVFTPRIVFHQMTEKGPAAIKAGKRLYMELLGHFQRKLPSRIAAIRISRQQQANRTSVPSFPA